jgi:multiple sugar transport system substrate-binding protein
MKLGLAGGVPASGAGRPAAAARGAGISRRGVLTRGAGSAGAGAALGGLVAAACSRGDPGAAGAPEAARPTGQPVKLTFFSPASDPTGDGIMRDQTTRFNAAHKDIQIDYVLTATDDNYKNYTTAMVSGAAPDVIMTYDFTPVPQWQAKGLIRDLERYRAEMKIRQEDFLANVWQMITFNGKLFGFLQEFDAYLLGINDEAAARAGLDPKKPPRTLDELDDWNARLTRKDGGTLTQIGILPWRHRGYDLWAQLSGGGYWDAAAGRFTINTKENAAGLAWMARTARIYGGYEAAEAFHAAESVTSRPSFYNARSALTRVGEWDPANNFSKEQPGFKYTVAFWPVAPGVPYGTGETAGGNTFVLPTEAPHPREAAAAMRHFAGPEMVWDWNVRENNLPPVKAVATDPKFREAVPLMGPWLDMLKVDKMKPVVASPLIAAFTTRRTEWGTRALKGETSPQQALDELQREMDVQVKQYETTKTLP